MSVEASIYAYLQTQAGVTGLVGTRVFPMAAAQGTATPYVVYSQFSDEPIAHSGGSSTLARKDFTFTVYADSQTQARSVADAIRLVLDGLANYTPAGGGTTLRSVLRQAERALISPDSDGGQEHSYQLDTDYRVFHLYTAPSVPT